MLPASVDLSAVAQRAKAEAPTCPPKREARRWKERRRVLIAGAGIGGLAAGLALQRAGWQVRIFERAASTHELGFALNLAPNAIAALTELGVAEDVVPHAHRPVRGEFRRGDGRVVRRLDGSRFRTEVSSLIAMRPVLHGALLSALPADAVSLNSEVVAFESSGDHVSIRIGDGRVEHGDVLIGADGVGSLVRQQLRPTEPPPRPSDYCALRGAVEDVDRILGDLSGVLYLDAGIEAAIVRAGAHSAYWYMSLLAADVGTAADARTVLNANVARLDQTFAQVADLTRDADVRFDMLYVRDPIRDWGQGRITLLGDAAHPMLPHTGQGAAQALEDAVALGLALGNASRVESALRRYERVRSARTARLVRRGPRIASMTTTRSRVVSALRTLMIRTAPLSLFAALYQLAGRRDPHRALR